MGIETWSPVAANNTASPPNGAPEGMNPGSVNDCLRQLMGDVRVWYENAQWIDPGYTPTYSSSTSFTLAGDKTSEFEVNRRVKAFGSTPFTIYGSISASTYSSPNTTVTVTWDSGSLNNTLSRVWYGSVKPSEAAVPVSAIKGNLVSSVAITAPAEFTVSGSPITSTGTIAISKATQAKNLVYAGPASGADAAPTFRGVAAADLGTGTTDATTYLAGDSTYKTTAVLQRVYAEVNTVVTLSSSIPADDTPPQNTEGTQVLTATIVPKSASSRLRVTFSGLVSAAGAATEIIVAMFRDSGTDALQARQVLGASAPTSATMTVEVASSATTSTTFAVRAGRSSLNAGTGYVNAQNNGTRMFGGSCKTCLIVEELM